MATIKSYTDLEQSKKLAEILPLESADMVLWGKDLKYVYADIHAQEFMKGLEDRKMNYVPCWSLASLLGVLPKTINFGYENDSTFSLNSLENGKYLADYYEISYVKDNPVDACVDMIIKLKEKGLL